ncbi:hypothetical protein EDD22DRAFT_1048920 [Suillus occidentalis]|nr:hypothetical protein EDD22DRAFT_1048920 [Suillus occidentalis]
MGSRPVDLRLPVSSRQLALTKFGVMLSDTPQTDLWIERTRLNGMIFGGVSYGIFTLLTAQAAAALMQRPRCGGKIANNRLVLLLYISITFALGTICHAANAKFTEMVWIDLRDAPGGPLALIENSLDYRINIVALFSYFIMGWCMQVLLVTTSAEFFAVDTMLLYLCMELGFTLIYTILVTSRLLVMRLPDEAGLSIVSDCDGLSNLFYLSITNVQGIAQLLIIIRVARRRAISARAWSTRVTAGPAAPTSIAFSRTISDIIDIADMDEISAPEQDGVALYSVHSAKAAEAEVCMV